MSRIYGGIYGFGIYGTDRYGQGNVDLDDENYTIMDSIARWIIVARQMTESITILDSVSRTVFFNRSMSESYSISDSISRLVTISRNMTETINYIDSIARQFSGNRAMSESFSLSDSILAIKDKPRYIDETISISEDFSAKWNKFEPVMVFINGKAQSNIPYGSVSIDLPKIYNIMNSTPTGFIKEQPSIASVSIDAPIINRSTPYIVGAVYS